MIQREDGSWTTTWKEMQIELIRKQFPVDNPEEDAKAQRRIRTRTVKWVEEDKEEITDKKMENVIHYLKHQVEKKTMYE